MKPPTFSPSKLKLWRRSSYEVLTSDVVASRRPGPTPPAAWAPTLRQLIGLSRKPTPAPDWWTPSTAYFGAIETRTDSATYAWDGLQRLARGDAPLFAFQLTLAGWGSFQLHGRRARRVPPGRAFIALIPSAHRYFLPARSPGWTFGWISIYHPYLLERMEKLVARHGPLLDVPPDSPLAAIAVRLMRGAIRKDFRDRFEVELALFQFLVACEESAHAAHQSSREANGLLDELRRRVVRALPQVLDVKALAAAYGMSRTHFSHDFRARTGMTPARFAAEVRVREASRALAESARPLKQIAEACGFADVNYFCKVFRRFQHMSPAAYRRALRHGWKDPEDADLGDDARG